MGKKGTVSTKKRRMGEAWTAADHVERNSAKQQGKKFNVRQQDRSHLLSHDTKEKREQKKLQLHITKTKRTLDILRERLQNWDDVTEKKIAKEEEVRRRKEEEEAQQPKKRRMRPGPETWKLRGAARPAWEVYDFDTRYVDPHMKAHEEASARAKRSRNLLVIYKNNVTNAPHVCREYLALLMQLALLYRDAGKIKAARSTFLECIDLDSREAPISLARCHLMRLYLEANRPDSAQRLCERLPEDDKSCWIQYSRLLMEYRNNKDDGDMATVHEALAQAVRANIYCAYYLAFGETFDSVVEYAEEIEDATDQEPLEEAIEYCNSEQRQAWEDEDGAQLWLQQTILAVNKKGSETNGLNPSDLDWKTALQQMEEAAEAAREAEEATEEEEDDALADDESVVDVLMFAGMFRTAMEMIEDGH